MIQLMRQFTIRTRMLGAVVVLAVALVAIGGVGVVAQLQSRSIATSFMQHDFSAMTQVLRLRTSMSALRSIEKDMIIQYGRDAEVARSAAAWKTRFDSITEGARALDQGLVHPEDRKKVASAMAHLELFKTRFDSVARTLASGGFDSGLGAATFMARAQVEYDQAMDIIKSLSGDIENEAHASGTRLEATAGLFMMAMIAAVGLALIVIVPATLANSLSIVRPIREAEALAAQIAAGNLGAIVVDARGKDEASQLLGALQRMHGSLRGMVSQVRASTDSIATASSEIATGNQDLSIRTEQTASNLQQAASSMTQLTGTVRQSADSARQANQLASSAAAVAARGGKVVSEVVTTMDEINASSKKISDIIGVIDGIAFQTNILALNAAVEAARAGEQGRGFAVVASEVRSLAQRSAQAAKEIKGLIGASVDRVEVGAKLVADAGQTMQEIVSSVQRVTDIIGEITAASSEQSDGIGQVNTAVTQLDQMTQQNAALVEQSAAAAESLREQAGKLATVVGTFRLDGSASMPASSSIPAARPAPMASSTSVKPVAKPVVKATAKTLTNTARPVARSQTTKPQAKAPARPAPVIASRPTPAVSKPAPMVASKPAATPPVSVAATSAPSDDWETF